MTDYYLRAVSQAALDVVLEQAGVLSDGVLAAGANIIRVGELPSDARYHANLRLLYDPTPEQLADLDAVTIDPPVTPYAVWAGS